MRGASFQLYVLFDCANPMENKAVYTADQVACGLAGSQTRLSKLLDRSSKAKTTYKRQES